MEQTEIAQLLVTMVADNTKLVKSFEKANSDISSRLDKIIVRANKFEGDLSTALGRAGTNAARRLTGALAAGVSLAALERFVSHISTVTENVEKQSRALGISTDAFQEWSLSAKHAGIEQDTFNTSIDFFSKNLGAAQLKVTPFGKLMTKLGVDIHAGPEKAFYQFVDAIGKINNAQQRNAVITLGMGRNAVQMAAFLDQGSAAIRRQGVEFKANGEIIDEQAIAKIHKLNAAWTDVKAQLTSAGANVLGGFADNFGKFMGGMESPAFQSAMKNFGAILAAAAKDIVAISGSGWFKYIAAGAVGLKLGGPMGGAAALAGTFFYNNHPGVQAPTNLQEAQDQLKQVQGLLDKSRQSDKTPYSVTINDILASMGVKLPNSQIARAAGITGLSTGELQSLRDIARKNVQHFQAQEGKNAPPPDIAAPSTGGIDLSGALSGDKKAKVSEYARAVQDLITRTKELSKAEDGSAESTARAEAKTRLLEAAQADGRKVTPALTAQINGLADAYASVVGARAFAKDLSDVDKEIAKLTAEAGRATLSVAALAEAEQKATLTEKFIHDRGRQPNADEQSVIAAEANKFGAATGGAQFGKDIQSANEANQAIADQIKTVGLYGQALAEAAMRQDLINKAIKDHGTLTAADIPLIDAAAKAHGLLTQQLEDEQKAEQNRVAVTDELRSGLENMAATGLTGFKDLKSAASSFLQELAQMILKLYVLEPLLNSLLGKQGTSGGGIFGSLLSSVLGSGGVDNPNVGVFVPPTGVIPFADGGVMTSRGRLPLRSYSGGGVASSPQLAMYGEGSGPEAFVPLKSGAIPVRLQSPRIPNASRSSSTSVVFAPQIDARGAQIGVADQIHQSLRAAFPVFLDAADRQSKAVFPERLRTTMRDHA